MSEIRKPAAIQIDRLAEGAILGYAAVAALLGWRRLRRERRAAHRQALIDWASLRHTTHQLRETALASNAPNDRLAALKTANEADALEARVFTKRRGQGVAPTPSLGSMVLESFIAQYEEQSQQMIPGKEDVQDGVRRVALSAWTAEVYRAVADALGGYPAGVKLSRPQAPSDYYRVHSIEVVESNPNAQLSRRVVQEYLQSTLPPVAELDYSQPGTAFFEGAVAVIRDS